MNRLDAGMFTYAGLATLWLAYLVVRESVRPGWPLLSLVVFWFVQAASHPVLADPGLLVAETSDRFQVFAPDMQGARS